MRFAFAWLLALATVFFSEPAQAHRCAVVDVELPASRVDAILNETDRNQRNELSAGLVNYWMIHCQSVREDADSAVVRQLARLLTHPETRFVAAMMLVDLDRSLRIARPALEIALADAKAQHERNIAASGGLMPNHHSLTALECVLRKLETGRIDEELCRELLSSRGDT